MSKPNLIYDESVLNLVWEVSLMHGQWTEHTIILLAPTKEDAIARAVAYDGYSEYYKPPEATQLIPPENKASFGVITAVFSDG